MIAEYTDCKVVFPDHATKESDLDADTEDDARSVSTRASDHLSPKIQTREPAITSPQLAERLQCQEINKKLHASTSSTALLEVVQSHALQFNARNTATALSRIVTLGAEPSRGVVLSMWERVCTHTDNFSIEECIAVLWVLANLRDDFEDILEDFSCGHLVSMLYQSAKLSQRRLTSQEVVAILWSLAVLEFEHAHLLDLVSSDTRDCVNELTAEDVTVLLWALARLQSLNIDFMQTFGEGIQSRMNLTEDPSESVAASIWVLSHLDLQDKRLMSALCEVAKAKIQSTIVWHMAQWYLATQLIKALE